MFWLFSNFSCALSVRSKITLTLPLPPYVSKLSDHTVARVFWYTVYWIWIHWSDEYNDRRLASVGPWLVIGSILLRSLYCMVRKSGRIFHCLNRARLRKKLKMVFFF